MNTSIRSTRLCRASTSTWSGVRSHRLRLEATPSFQHQHQRFNSTNRLPPSSSNTLFDSPTPIDYFPTELMMSELITPFTETIIAPTFFEPFSTVLLSFPPSLNLSYAIFIPLFSIVLRLSTTVPITLWQRKRTKKFAQVVLPQIRKAQEIARVEVRAACRKAGKSYEEYQIAYKERARKDAAQLSAAYSCRPIVTMLVPPLLNLPLFITTTLVLRDACQRSLKALSSLSLDPSSSPSLDSNMVLYHLHDFATTSFLHCPSLVLPDPGLYLPLAVGLAVLSNVEFSSNNRKAVASAVRAGEIARQEDSAPPSVESQRVTTRERLRSQAIKGWEMKQQAGSRQLSTTSSASARGMTPGERAKESAIIQFKEQQRETMTEKAVDTSKESEELGETRTTRLITGAMRFGAVAFIAIAAQAPAAVCAYWLTSNLFTLAQNATFAFIDRREEEDRITKRRLNS